MSDNEPWYAEHSRKPEGAFGSGATTNPENRRGVSLSHHRDYGSENIKKHIKKGLEILKEDNTRVVMVGGDLKRCGLKKYYHIRWVPSEKNYVIADEGNSERLHCEDISSVISKLNLRFRANSFVCVLLIYIKNSPFNTSGPSGSVSDYLDIRTSYIKRYEKRDKSNSIGA